MTAGERIVSQCDSHRFSQVLMSHVLISHYSLQTNGHCTQHTVVCSWRKQRTGRTYRRAPCSVTCRSDMRVSANTAVPDMIDAAECYGAFELGVRTQARHEQHEAHDSANATELQRHALSRACRMH